MKRSIKITALFLAIALCMGMLAGCVIDEDDFTLEDVSVAADLQTTATLQIVNLDPGSLNDNITIYSFYLLFAYTQEQLADLPTDKQTTTWNNGFNTEVNNFLRKYPDNFFKRDVSSEEVDAFKAGTATTLTGEVSGKLPLAAQEKDITFVGMMYGREPAGSGYQTTNYLTKSVSQTIFNVSFETFDGSNIKSQQVVTGSKATRPENDPTKLKNDFDGWYADEDCTVPFDFDTPITASTTVYAKWKHYNVLTFVALYTGVENVPVPQKVYDGDKAIYPDCPTKNGYDFYGWFTDLGLNNEFDFDTVITQDMLLYAKFIEVHTITFDANGGECEYDTLTTNGVMKLDFLPEATKLGFDFAGWFNGSTKATLDDVYTEDTTLTAHWTKTDISKIFKDIPKNAWYKDAVYDAYFSGLMDGVGDGLFAPNTDITRGMFVTILYRLAGQPKVDKAAPFTDLTAKWYKDAVAWGYKTGVVKGFSKTEFGPDIKVSREQIATMLYRYAKYAKMDVSAKATISGFSDAKNVSAYAKPAVEWAVAKGLIVGIYDKLMPKSFATRAEVATILQRFKNL